MSTAFRFPRTELAKSFTRELLGEVPLVSHASGLFLSAPRRTGKSTFLREDLIPELTARGYEPVYVDFWSDRSLDPAALLSAAIRSALDEHAGPASRMGRKAGLTKVGIGNFASFDLTKPAAEGLTLAAALRELVKRLGRPVALILDEAQHASVTEAGTNAMFALKAARDALNIGDPGTGVAGHNLVLVMTGSNRDRLARMVSDARQPFFGADVTPFPHLSRDYTDALTLFSNERLASSNALDPIAVWEAFEAVGYRPEHLNKLIRLSSLSKEGSANMTQILKNEATSFRRQAFAEFDLVRESLTPVQTAVLVQIVAEGADFSPYAANSLDAYARRLNGVRSSKSEIQAAINALREKGLVFRSDRGRYELEDASVARWVADEAGFDVTP